MAIVSGLEADEQTRTAIPPAVYLFEFILGFLLDGIAARLRR